MIIDFDTSYKDYNENILSFYGIWNYKCPCCHASGSLNRHGTYHRYLLVLTTSLSDTYLLEELRLEILRLRCSSCGHTHAVLPAECIPFTGTSVYLLITVCSHFYQKQSVTSTASNFQISWQFLYLLISRLQLFQERLELLMRELNAWNQKDHITASIAIQFFAKNLVNNCWLFFARYASPFGIRRKSTNSYPLVFSAYFLNPHSC